MIERNGSVTDITRSRNTEYSAPAWALSVDNNGVVTAKQTPTVVDKSGVATLGFGPASLSVSTFVSGKVGWNRITFDIQP